jgi:hypothetical protein
MKKISIILILFTCLSVSGIAYALVDSISSFVSIKDFELIWDTDTYVPFGYEGRNLPVKAAQINVYALIDTISGDPNSLKYSWFLEDIFQTSKSGYGRTSFSFYATQTAGLKHAVRLQIFNEDRSIFMERSIEIPITGPELIVYSTNTNTYFSNQASKISTIISNKECSIIVKPYFFSIKKLSDLTFEWNLSGQEPIKTSGYGASILKLTVENTGGDELKQNSLWVSATNNKDPRQKATETIKLNIH